MWGPSAIKILQISDCSSQARELGSRPASQLAGFQDALAFWRSLNSFQFDCVASQNGVPTAQQESKGLGRLCLWISNPNLIWAARKAVIRFPPFVDYVDSLCREVLHRRSNDWMTIHPFVRRHHKSQCFVQPAQAQVSVGRWATVNAWHPSKWGQAEKRCRSNWLRSMRSMANLVLAMELDETVTCQGVRFWITHWRSIASPKASPSTLFMSSMFGSKGSSRASPASTTAYLGPGIWSASICQVRARTHIFASTPERCREQGWTMRTCRLKSRWHSLEVYI